MGVLQTVLDGVEVAPTCDGVEVLLGHTCCRATGGDGALRRRACVAARVFDAWGAAAVPLGSLCSLASVPNPNTIPSLL